MTDEEYLRLSRGTLGEHQNPWFLIGMRKLGEGDREAGLNHLRELVRVQSPWMYTYEYARVILAVVEREPTWPPPPTPHP